MADGNSQKNIKAIFFIPSFYGALTWGIWLSLYMLRLIRVDEWSTRSLALYLFVEAMFMLSAFVSLPSYVQAAKSGMDDTSFDASLLSGKRSGGIALLSIMHGIGFLGLTAYVINFSKNLGGIAGFFLALVNEAYAIRWEAETSSSVGTQLSYFGWIAIALTVYHVSRKKISGYWLIPALIQFLGNLLFIDRTRPFWIILTALLMLLPAAREINTKKAVRSMIGISVLLLLIFWAIAEWTGKTGYEGKYDNSLLPGITQEVYAYGISGYAYFNKMLDSNEHISYRPERIVYPALRLFSGLGLTKDPPSQIIDFYDVPFSTNVGTFLEPFYRDGGMLFVLCGILLYSFGFDSIGLYLLRSRKPLAIYAWSNLCFVVIMCFFTPQATFFPTWLFIFIGMASMTGKLVAATGSGPSTP